MTGFDPRLSWNLITGVLWWLWSGQTLCFPYILHGAHELIEIPRYIFEVASLAAIRSDLGILYPLT